MKNVSYVINGVLAVAIIILFVLFFTSKNNCGNTVTTGSSNSDSTATLPIAYVNVDSLLAKYEFAKTESERLLNKFKSSQGTLAQKQRQLQSEYADFQDKIQKNIFLSQERAQQEAQRIQKLEADLQQMGQRIEGELAQEEMKINVQIADSVRLYLKEFNKKANFQVIFSNNRMDNILIANEKYDVTNQVLEGLNSRYKKPATAK